MRKIIFMLAIIVMARSAVAMDEAEISIDQYQMETERLLLICQVKYQLHITNKKLGGAQNEKSNFAACISESSVEIERYTTLVLENVNAVGKKEVLRSYGEALVSSLNGIAQMENETDEDYVKRQNALFKKREDIWSVFEAEVQ